jgi:hypothetical protein
MRLSEFWRAVTDEFGADYGRALVRDIVLTELDDRTGEAAIAVGLPVREVWLALCRAMDVPASRWYGVGQLRKD